MTDLSAVPLLSSGGHSSDDGKMCVMEAVAYVAGEPWSDHPQCACPVISAFLRAWNDDLPDDERDGLLRPLIPLLIGTRSTAAVERKRSVLAADWFIRTFTPAWLRLAKLTVQADLLAGLPEITDMAQCPSLMPALTAIRQAAARDAAGAAARDAAWAAAGDAARDAAWIAAWGAARGVAWAAAGAVAWDAAMAAAAAAASAAAKVDLTPTRLTLQQSALTLVHRMIACTEQPA